MCGILLYFYSGILITVVSPFLATSTAPTVFPLVPCGTESGDMVTLGCLATGFNPPAVTFSWNKGSTALTDFIQYPAVQKGDVYTGVSQTTFTCQFTGGEDGSLNKTVPYKVIPTCPDCVTSNVKVEITGPATEDMLLDKKGTLTCRVTVQKDKPQIMWEDENKEEIASKPMIEENGMTYLSKLDITYDEWSRGVKRYCVVHHSDLLTPSREPYEREFAEVTLTCFVKDFLPKEVFVSWLVDDEEADSSSYAFNTTEPIENNGFYSAYGQLFVSLHEWKNNAVYSCVVYHESVVNTTRAIVRSIGYRTFDKNPEHKCFTSAEKTINNAGKMIQQ
uniref:Ig-like domain-containing protein n=1 Tax=Maylandia zebra TaxID=106582 RepID=A0A3P9C3W6_9CICH